MPEPKFFVWARGRWRELCLSSGRVQGAGGPVRFLYVRGGRLQAARAPRVLRALRALAAGQPAAAKDGAPLPQRRRARRPHRSHSCRRHHCCAAHTQCTTSFSEAPKPRAESPPRPQPPPPRADAAIQVNPAPPAREQTQPGLLQSPKAGTAKVPPRPRAKRKRSRSPRKRERSDTSADALSLAAFKRREFCKELLINETDADLFRSYLIEHDHDFDLYRFDTDEAYKMQFFYRINPLVTLVPCRQLEAMLLRRASQDTISLKDFATKLGLRSISDQEESENNKRYKMRRRTKNLAQSSTTTSDRDTDKENFVQNRRALAPTSHKKKDSIGEKNKKEVTNNKRNDSPVVRESRRKDTSLEDTHKSDDTPVDRTLRKRLMVAAVQRNIGNFGKSEENKEVTNNKRKGSPVGRENTKRDTPGANKEKPDDPPVNRFRRRLMVAAVQCSDDRNIGNLDKSVENSSVGKNDKKNVENRSNKSDTKSIENNRSNNSDTKSVESNNLPQNHKKGVEKSSTSKDNGKSVNNNKVGAVVSASTSSSESGREFSASKPRFFTRKKPAVPKPSAVKLMSQTSKRSSMTSIGSKKCGGGREYLPLEDHAIVAFVSNGDRARRVNGNLLWRDLQEQYHRLTGQSRSWHSLRNRYLRYILPALGQLALAPALVARLRANAAKGEIKSRKHPSAPNPLCVVPRVRSAFAARPPSPAPSRSPSPTPQPPPLPASEERAALRARRRKNTDTPPAVPASAPPRRSLRSSGVAPPGSPPARPPSRPPTASVRPRMRKLFNPNAHTMR